MKTYDPYELMIIPPNKKTQMIIGEIYKDEPNLNLISDLIVLGANLDWQDEESYGITVLHVATLRNNMEVVKMLVEAGADVNIQNDHGYTAYNLVSVTHSSEELREYLMLRTNLTTNFNIATRRI